MGKSRTMTENPQPEEKSRSQLKREYLELKELGKQLARLSEGQLRAVPLSKKTHDAVAATRQLTRKALQRQFRYLAALLVEEDVAPIRLALAGELQPHAEEVATLHKAEHWRDKLLSDDDGEVAAFAEQHPECDRTRLRQLVRNAKKERELEKPPKSARQLFRYLKQLFDSLSDGRG